MCLIVWASLAAVAMQHAHTLRFLARRQVTGGPGKLYDRSSGFGRAMQGTAMELDEIATFLKFLARAEGC